MLIEISRQNNRKGHTYTHIYIFSPPVCSCSSFFSFPPFPIFSPLTHTHTKIVGFGLVAGIKFAAPVAVVAAASTRLASPATGYKRAPISSSPSTLIYYSKYARTHVDMLCVGGFSLPPSLPPSLLLYTKIHTSPYCYSYSSSSAILLFPLPTGGEDLPAPVACTRTPFPPSAPFPTSSCFSCCRG